MCPLSTRLAMALIWLASSRAFFGLLHTFLASGAKVVKLGPSTPRSYQSAVASLGTVGVGERLLEAFEGLAEALEVGDFLADTLSVVVDPFAAAFGVKLGIGGNRFAVSGTA